MNHRGDGGILSGIEQPEQVARIPAHLIQLKEDTAKLLKLCGGLEGPQSIKGWRWKKSVMSDWQNRNEKATIPAEAIWLLEDYCGEPVVSSGITQAVETAHEPDCVMRGTMEVGAAVGELTDSILAATEDGKICQREAEDIHARAGKVQEKTQRLRSNVGAQS